ncbi:MAG: type VI secretion system-associated FHA domain protein TagH [Pseudomonadota bacterium]
MSVTLTLENAPHAQAETQKTFLGGQLVIGRGDECDWRFDDPDMFVSRKHCIITDEGGAISIVDASSGGVFIDGASTPLGNGNVRPLEHDMRFRLGDFVIRVEMQASATAQVSEAKPPSGGGDFFDFGTPDPDAHKTKPRPVGLPDPFGVRSDGRSAEDHAAPTPTPRPIDQRDPFGLDLNQKPDPVETGGGSSFGGGSSYFDDPPREVTPPPQKPPVIDDDPPYPPIEVTHDPAIPPTPPPEPPVASTGGAPTAGDGAAIAALYRGLGLSEEDAAEATLEEVEAIGARLRDSVDGLMFLLRTRAQEKQKIRVAQTIIANSDVNPLKFLASTDEAILALIRGRDASYLSGDKAVTQSYRDLADHQIRTWQALQTALRRMIDRFDPEEVERELEETGFLEKIVAGGSSAKMWQLYQERYREIAKSAEERFLGEVGADFRDAYETKGS